MIYFDDKRAEFGAMVEEYGAMTPLEDVKTEVTAALQLVFDANRPLGLEAIVLQGYTPRFIDGDPCTHSTTCFALFEGFYTADSIDDEDVRLPQWLIDRRPTGEEEKGRNALHAYLRGNGREHPTNVVERFMQVGKMAQMLERIYDTNFRLLIYIGGEGRLVVEHEDYHCGY